MKEEISKQIQCVWTSKELFHGSDTKVINIIWREGGRGGRKRKTEKMLRGETKVTLN